MNSKPLQSFGPMYLYYLSTSKAPPKYTELLDQQLGIKLCSHRIAEGNIYQSPKLHIEVGMPEGLLAANPFVWVDLQASLHQGNQLSLPLELLLQRLQFHNFLYVLQLLVPIVVIDASVSMEHLAK